jgi:hypothetical protein
MCQKRVFIFLMDRILNQEPNKIYFMNFGKDFELIQILEG